MLDDRYPAHRLPEHLFERRRHRCRQQVTPAEQPPASDPHLIHDEILHPRQTISTGPSRSALYAATRPLEYNSYATTTESARPMKTLFLVRHAKSSWEDAALPDKERPLNERGIRDAPRMGKRLAKRDARADLILSSPARRALTTAQIIAKAIGYRRKNIVVDDRLYPGAANRIFQFIRRLDKALDRVMIVGHDPALTELAHRLSSEITHLPTGAVAEFTFDAKSWPMVDKSSLAAVRLERPKKS